MFSWTLTPPSEPSMPPPPATRAGTNSNRTAATDGHEIRQDSSSPHRGPEVTRTWTSPFIWASLDLKNPLTHHTKLVSESIIHLRITLLLTGSRVYRRKITTVLPPGRGSPLASSTLRLQLPSAAQHHQGFPIRRHQCKNVG